MSTVRSEIDSPWRFSMDFLFLWHPNQTLSLKNDVRIIYPIWIFTHIINPSYLPAGEATCVFSP